MFKKILQSAKPSQQIDKISARRPSRSERSGVDCLQSDSKILGVVCATFGDTNTKYVLDFSKAKQKNIDFFAQFPCYYHILDFYQAFQSLPTAEMDEELNAAYYDTLIADFEQQLKESGAHKYDVVFLWDLFNYLSGAQVKKIFSLLKSYCHWKTHVYCMLNLNSKIPKEPMNCYVVDHNTVGYEMPLSEEGLIKNPNNFKHGMTLGSSDYKLQHSSLLKSGIKEMLFSLERE